MKFFVAFALIATVASAAYIKPTQVSAEMAEIGQIVAAIQSPSTDPATAAALEAMLFETLGINPISVGPAIVESNPISVGPAIIESNPISVGPAMIDFPLPDGGLVTAVEPAVVNPSPVVAPSPVVIGEIPAGSSPLVQIIVNVQSQQESAVVAPSPADNAVVEEVYQPGPVNVVDNVIVPESVISPIQVVEPVIPGPVNIVDNVIAPESVISPIQVVEPVIPGPVNIVDNVVVEPVQVAVPVVVEPVQVAVPIVVEPVQVGTPIIPSPVVALPDELN